MENKLLWLALAVAVGLLVLALWYFFRDRNQYVYFFANIPSSGLHPGMPYDEHLELTLDLSRCFDDYYLCGYWYRLLKESRPMTMVRVCLPAQLYKELLSDRDQTPHVTRHKDGYFEFSREAQRLLARAGHIELLRCTDWKRESEALKAMTDRRAANKANDDSRQIAREVTAEALARVKDGTATADDWRAVTRYLDQGEYTM